jgi:two-component system response regulator YesN
MNRAILSTIPLLKSELAIYLINSNFDENTIIEKLKLSNLMHLKNAHFSTLLILASSKKELPQNLMGVINKELLKKIEKEFADKNLDAIYSAKSEKLFVVHLYSSKKIKSDMVKTLCYDIINKVKQQIDIMIAVGDGVVGINNVRQSYLSAAIQLEKGFFIGYGSVICAGSDDLAYQFDDEIIAQFYKCLDIKQKEDSIQIVLDITDDLKNYTGTLIIVVKNYYYKFALQLIKIAEERNVDIFAQYNHTDFLWEKVYNILTLDAFSEFIINMIDTLFEHIDKDYMGEIANEIKKYINLNYHKPDLSINDICKYIKLSSSYICVLFKKETGKTINQYITECRIQKSKELFFDRSKSLAFIAKEVGYYDENYFCKLFKKVVGILPSNYRKRHSS